MLPFLAFLFSCPQMNQGLLIEVRYYSNSTSNELLGTVSATEGDLYIIDEAYTPQRSGAVFISWNICSDGSGESYQAGDSIQIGTENILLFGQWKLPGSTKYQLRYDGNGANDIVMNSYNGELLENEIFCCPDGDLLNKHLFVFKSWNTKADGSGDTYSSGKFYGMPASDLTLYAQWAGTETYSVVYDGNGYEGEGLPVDTNRYEIGDEIYILPPGAEIVREGYRLPIDSWFYNQKYDDDIFSSSLHEEEILKLTSYFVLKNNTLTFYLNWEQLYSVTYEFDDDVTGTLTTDDNYYGKYDTVILPEPADDLKKEGYYFYKWKYIEEDGDERGYFPGDEFEISYYADSYDITFSAVWLKGLIISFDDWDADSGTLPDSFLAEDDFMAPSHGDLGKTGYRFGGWLMNYIDDNGEPESSLSLYQEGESVYFNTYEVSGYLFKPLWIPEQVEKIYAGDEYCGFIDKSGTVYTAGDTSYIFYEECFLPVFEYSSIKSYSQANYWTDRYSYLLTDQGSVYSRGLVDNENIYANPTYYGQMGIGTYINETYDWQHVADNIKYIFCSERTALLIDNDNVLWGCGDNSSRQLGPLTEEKYKKPTKVAENVESAVTKGKVTLFKKTDGSLWGMGNDEDGALGIDGSVVSTPVKLADSVISFDIGLNDCSAEISYYFDGEFCAYVKSDGTLWMSGKNSCGQLGSSLGIDRDSFFQVETDVKKVTLGNDFTLILKTDESLWGWGISTDGQLGTLNKKGTIVPLEIMSGIKDVEAGSNHAIALKQDGSVLVWGGNGKGQLGTGDYANLLSPTELMDFYK